MKTILGLTVGTLLGWLVWGYFTNDFSAKGFFMFLCGMILGYLIGRREQVKETKETLDK